MSVFSAKAKFPVQEWEVKASRSDDIWRIGLWSDHKFSCTCPSFKFKENSCKHIRGKRTEIENLYGNIHNYLEMLKERKNIKE